MKFAILAALGFAAANVHANTVNFRCTGILRTGDTVTISGTYAFDGGDYRMLSDLSVSGTDGDGDSLFSDGSGGGTEAYFARNKVRMRGDGDDFHLRATSDSGSILTIDHPEGGKRNSISVDLQPNANHGAYSHVFQNARCNF